MNLQEAYQISKDFLAIKPEFFTKQQFEKLGELIAFHSELYYEKEKPLISDSEYDTLFKKLEALEKLFHEDIHISHSVGSELKQSSFEKVAHSRPMISLDNTYNEEDLQDFDTRVKKLADREDISYMLEFKFDGLGIELIYEDGILVQAITRGNGVEGEDVTENIRQISNIPKKINKSGNFEVRGEVVMPISSFERLNNEAKEKGEKIFSNPRNAASGSLRVLDIEITKKRDLKFFAYDVSDFSEYSSENYEDMIYGLENLGFEISSYFKKNHNISELIENIHTIGEIKKQIDFEIDGLVLKVNNMSLWSTIGFTEHHPRYAIAYKFPAEIVTTKLLSVEHSVGRTGTITPVANLEAVNIGGAIIRRATLHNYEEVEKLGVKIGDSVFLKRAGEVIPKIISVALSPDSSESGLEILAPKFCPSCNSEVKKDEDKVRYYCPNAYGCPAQMREKLAFAVGKQGFNIDGFGEKQAELFYTLGFIQNFGDIFRLKNYREEILNLEGFKEKSVSNLLEGIEKVRNTHMVIFLKALGIPGVGKKTAKTLGKYISERVRTQKDSGLWEFSQEELEALPDIGPEVAQSVVTFFTEQKIMVTDLLSELEIVSPTQLSQFSLEKGDEEQIGKWKGKKICITGSFDGYSRDNLTEILEKQGGEFMSSVSQKTDYLLAGEKAGSKLKKAQELGVKVLSLEDFL